MNRTILIIAALIISIAAVSAQQPKAEPKPITLSAEASVQWLEDQRQINELQQTIENLQLKQKILAAKAQVPDDYTLSPVLDAQRRVVYVPPPKQEAAKASPSPK